MSEELKYKIGDRVWVVFDRGNPKYLTISKIEKKWVTLDCDRNWRFLQGSNDLEEPGRGKIGRIFRSQEQWESIVTGRIARDASTSIANPDKYR